MLAELEVTSVKVPVPRHCRNLSLRWCKGSSHVDKADATIRSQPLHNKQICTLQKYTRRSNAPELLHFVELVIGADASKRP